MVIAAGRSAPAARLTGEPTAESREACAVAPN